MVIVQKYTQCFCNKLHGCLVCLLSFCSFRRRRKPKFLEEKVVL